MTADLTFDAPLAVTASEGDRTHRYTAVLRRLDALLEGENDAVAAMATTASELHHAFAYFHWTGFYRATAAEELVIGPYQGGHGCLRIPYRRGVCGAAARTRQTQFVPDVHAFPDHIACAASTQSEVVAPVLAPDGRLLAVLDIDSDLPAAFTAADQHGLEAVCARLGTQFAAARW